MNQKGPLRVLLQFLRVRESGDSYGFRFEPQDYILPSIGGETPVARFPWTPETFADLQALSRPGCDPEVVQRVGEQLRSFVKDAGWAQHEQDIAHAISEDRPVFLTIRSSAAELYTLPWELLTLKSGQFIGECDRLLLRFEWPESASAQEAPRPRSVGGRILLAWSGAGGQVPAADHCQAIQAACAAGYLPFSPDADVLAHASVGRLVKTLQNAQKSGSTIAVLHLLCHGAAVGRTFGLALDGEGDGLGGPVVVDAAQLRQLAPFAPMVRLIVLSACDTGNLGALGNRLGSVALALHRCGFQSVIASRFPLSISGSIGFTQSLYRELLAVPASLESAFLAARKQLALTDAHLPQEHRHRDWVSLQLYARHRDGDDTRPIVFRPFRGLLAFQAEHRRFFYGRGPEIQKIKDNLQALIDRKKERFLVVAGASGTGKSSLVLAGAAPALLSANPQLRLVKMRPGSEPESALDEALSQLPAGAPGLLFVDQFEEVFTQTQRPAAREAFVRRLWALASAAAPSLCVITTLRVDFIGRCGELVLNAEGLRMDGVAYDENYRVFVSQLQPEQLRALIAEPARKVGLEMQEGLVDRILQEVGHEPGALPLLEDALDVLWQHRDGRLLTQRAYDELGGVVGALQKRADALIDRLTPAHLAIAQHLLISLVAVGDDTMLDTRLRVPLADVETSFSGEEHLGFAHVRKELVAARLLVEDGDGQAAHLEVAHEALIRKWPRLRAWLNEGRAGLVVLRRVKQAAQEWEKQKHDESLLYRGTQLAQITEWRKSVFFHLGELERQFLSTSEALGIRQEQEAAERLQRERKAAERIRQLLLDTYLDRGHHLLFTESKTDEGLLWLHRAYLEGCNNTALPYLLRSAMKNIDTIRAVLHGHGDSVWSARFSPDGQRIVTASMDRTARVFDAVDGRLVAELTGHLDNVWSATYSPDGRYIVTASADKKARIFSAENGRLVAELGGHSAGVRSAAYSPDGRWIVTASEDRSARIFDAAQGRTMAVLKGHKDSVWSATFSPDGRCIVTASADKLARVFAAESGQLIAELLGHQDIVWNASFSPDGRHIVTASKDRTARIFHAADGRLVAELRGHQDIVWSASFSPDGRRIVTASDDATARIYLAENAHLVAELKGHRSRVWSATFSPDSRQIVTASNDHTARIFDAETGHIVAEFQGHRDCVRSAVFSPDGRRIVTASTDHTARIFKTEGGHLVAECKGHQDGVLSAVFSPDGRRIVTASTDRAARLFDAESGQLVTAFQGHRDKVYSAQFSPDGRRIVTASRDTTARLFDAESGHLLSVLTGHRFSVICAQFSPDGRYIVTASLDKTARVFGVEDGGLVSELTGHRSNVMSARFSPDGRYIVTASDDHAVRIFVAGTGHLVMELHGHGSSVMNAAFSPDGRCIVTASLDNVARLFDAQDGQLIAILAGHDSSVMNATFSADGHRIVTAGASKSARVFDGADGRFVAELKGHRDTVWDASFSPDRQVVVTASEDQVARIFAAEDGRLVGELRGHSAGVVGARFDRRGRRVVTASRDKTARVWDVAPEDRGPEQLAKLLHAHLPIRFERDGSNVIVPCASD